MNNTLKERLHNWLDFDIALHQLSMCLGLTDISIIDFYYLFNNKFVYWSSNPDGDMLEYIMLIMIERGILERDEETEKVRWNPNFKPCWESKQDFQK